MRLKLQGSPPRPGAAICRCSVGRSTVSAASWGRFCLHLCRRCLRLNIPAMSSCSPLLVTDSVSDRREFLTFCSVPQQAARRRRILTSISLLVSIQLFVESDVDRAEVVAAVAGGYCQDGLPGEGRGMQAGDLSLLNDLQAQSIDHDLVNTADGSGGGVWVGTTPWRVWTQGRCPCWCARPCT